MALDFYGKLKNEMRINKEMRQVSIFYLIFLEIFSSVHVVYIKYAVNSIFSLNSLVDAVVLVLLMHIIEKKWFMKLTEYQTVNIPI